MPEGRSARFEVTWVDDFEAFPNGPPPDREAKDYIVLELRADDIERLRKQLDLTLLFNEKTGNSEGHLCICIQGRAYPQAADRLDGTRGYPPSLLSEEVLAESPRPDRWK